MSQAHATLKDLPAESTDAGAMARLFITEVEIPAGRDMSQTRRAMEMMRCVLQNRLKRPRDFGANPYANTITEIIAAHHGHIQFQEFATYPVIGSAQKNNIEDRINVAKNAKDIQ